MQQRRWFFTCQIPTEWRLIVRAYHLGGHGFRDGGGSGLRERTLRPTVSMASKCIIHLKKLRRRAFINMYADRWEAIAARPWFARPLDSMALKEVCVTGLWRSRPRSTEKNGRICTKRTWNERRVITKEGVVSSVLLTK